MSADADKNVTQKGYSKMWFEKIIEAKKAQGLSAKTMSERSRMHLTERTIIRILNRETKAPKIDVILDVGATVGLTAHQLFAETDLVPFDREELDRLKGQVSALSSENELLRLKLSHLEELLAVHNHYNKINRPTADT